MHPFTSYPAKKYPKRSKFAITDMQQNPYCVERLLCIQQVTFRHVSTSTKAKILRALGVKKCYFSQFMFFFPNQ